MRKLLHMPPKRKSLADRAAEEIAARKARDAAQARLTKVGQVVGPPLRRPQAKRNGTRDNTLRHVQARAASSAAAAAARTGAAAMHSRPSTTPVPVPVPDLPPGWSAARVPPQGSLYYYHSNGTRQWGHPSTAPAAPSGPLWRPVRDEASGGLYWWHTMDGRVSWNVPLDVDIPGMAGARAAMAPPAPARGSAAATTPAWASAGVTKATPPASGAGGVSRWGGVKRPRE